MQETKVVATTSLSSASCSTSSTRNHKDSDNGNQNGNGSGNHNGNIMFHSSMFAPLSSFLPSMSQNPASSFPALLTPMPNSEQLTTYPVEQPPVLSLSPLYQIPSSAACDSYSTALPQPAMSATALLQKAAQMGAAASGSSRFCGFGFIPSQHQQAEDGAVKLENEGMVADRLVQLPSSGNFNGSGPVMDDPSAYFGSKPMTLDFLGLGNSSSAAHAYLTSIGNPIDVAVTAFERGSDSLVKVSWDGQAAQRRPNDTVL